MQVTETLSEGLRREFKVSVPAGELESEIESRLGELSKTVTMKALYRLEDAGLVRARWEKDVAARPGPRRRIYALTPRGRHELTRHRKSWNDFVSVVGTIMEAQS